MPAHPFAKKGSRKHTGTGNAFTGSGANGAAPWFGFKALDDVTVTTILGPKFTDDNGTAGQLSSIKLKEGDEFIGGQIDSITVPSGKVILLYPL